MHVLERPQQQQTARQCGTNATLRASTLAALAQRQSCGYSREFIRESVMRWAAREWPDLLIGRDPCGIRFDARSPSASVEIGCAVDGEYVWSFRGSHSDAAGELAETRVLVVGGRGHDRLALRTARASRAGPGRAGAQPSFLAALVDHLPFEDSGHPIASKPTRVSSVAAFDSLRDHLFSRRRTLPVLVVAAVPTSDGSAARMPSATALARTLCGLAHVASVDAQGLAGLEACMGTRMAIGAGEARLFMPGLEAGAEPAAHPMFSASAAPHSAASHVEAAAQVATHAWSTSAARCAAFDALWAETVGP